MNFTNEDPPHVLIEEIQRLRHALAVAHAERRAVERLYLQQGGIYNDLLAEHTALVHREYPTETNPE